MKIPTICRYCGGKIIKSTTRALYPKGSEPIYLCVNCNAYVGCYHDLEIARMFQVKPGEIKLEMDQARSKVVPFPTETAALAA